jgi:uncharacterized UBP type Zn finger protein
MEHHKQEVFNQLQEMGYPESEINRGWEKSSIQTIEGIINYLDSNPLQTNPLPETLQEESKKNKGVGEIVKKELVEGLQATGYSLLISEKAVLLSGNKTLEDALEWIQQHKDDPDFEEPVEVEQKPQLSKEEARLKALELSKEIREKQKEIDEKNKMESEKLRLKMAKEMAETRRLVKEQEQRLAAEAYVREKKKLEEEKQLMKEKLEQDHLERFGKKKTETKQIKKSPKSEFTEIYNKMYNIYRMGQFELLLNCLKMLKLYLKNILNSPEEEKFRKINASNTTFCTKVKDIIGATSLLELFGFQLIDGFYFMEHIDVEKLTLFQEIIDEKIFGIQNYM